MPRARLDHAAHCDHPVPIVERSDSAIRLPKPLWS